MKRCSRCHRFKRFALFCKDKTRTDGHQCWCKACERRVYKRDRRSAKNSFYLKRYGITIEEVETKTKLQEGRCAICKHAIALVIDHCHITKRFRGMLCNNCNLGLGKFKDNIESLEVAIAYLQS